MTQDDDAMDAFLKASSAVETEDGSMDQFLAETSKVEASTTGQVEATPSTEGQTTTTPSTTAQTTTTPSTTAQTTTTPSAQEKPPHDNNDIDMAAFLSEASKAELESDKSADEWKKLGNGKFSKGDNQGAVACYSSGIAVDPKSYVLFSNRSAAYLKMGAFDKALEDANTCVTLNPVWGKAFGRKGAALFAQGKFKQAYDAYTEGLIVDKSNASLKQEQQKCKNMLESSSASAGSGGAAAKSDQDKQDDDDLASFMAQVDALDPQTVPATLKKTAVDHDKETHGWTPRNQIDRVLCRSYEWMNLNPFRVFAIAHNATDDDIKTRYYRLSQLLHPDKNPDPRAMDAFDQIKAAYDKLKKEQSRSLYVRTIDRCTKEVIVARNRLKRKGLTETDLIARDGTLEMAIEKKIKVEFADQHRKKLHADRHRQSYTQREREEEEEKQTYWKNVKTKEESFREGREGRAKNWQGFAKKSRKTSKKRQLKPPTLKTEANERRETELKKYKGVGLDESYKTNWR